MNSLSLHIDCEKMLSKAEGMFLQLKAAAPKLPSVVCELLGLPLPPDSGASHEAAAHERGVSPHTTSDDDEAFEQAISQNFL